MPDRPVKTFASLEEAALDALADEDDEDLCEACGEPGTEDGTYCLQCKIGLGNNEALACPFCVRPSHECEHRVFVADGETGWVQVPVVLNDLPFLEDDGGQGPDWLDGERQEVFGDLAALAGTYEQPCGEPYLTDFYECLAALLAAPVVVCDGVNAVAAYSEHDRDAAYAEAEAIIGRLAEAFERLAARRCAASRGAAGG